MRKKDDDQPVWLTTAAVRARYGVSHMWIERRMKDGSGFPKYTLLGRLRFWRLTEIEEWERKQAAGRAA